jgi:hypothetical protein
MREKKNSETEEGIDRKRKTRGNFATTRRVAFYVTGLW